MRSRDPIRGPVGVDSDIEAVAQRASTGEHAILGAALTGWLRSAAASYTAADFATVSAALANARAVYVELTTVVTRGRFGPWVAEAPRRTR